MHEHINKIKKGEIKYFVEVVEVYIDRVYSATKLQYDDDKALSCTYEIFMKLYKRILAKPFWQSSTGYIEKTLKKIYSEYRIKWSNKSNDQLRAPDSVMRRICIKLSKKDKFKGSQSAFKYIVGISAVLVVVSVGMWLKDKSLHAGTINDVSTEFEKVHSLSLYDNSGRVFDKTVKLTKLVGEGIAIKVEKSSKSTCEIYIGDKLKGEFEVPKKQMLISGSYEDDIYTFTDTRVLYNYNSVGELLAKKQIEGIMYLLSKNNEYLALEDNGSYSIINLLTLKEIAKVNNKVYSISDKGYFVTEEMIAKAYDNNKYGGEIIDIVAFDENKIAMLFSNQLLALYENEEIVWQKQLDFTNLQESNVIHILYQGYLLADTRRINVVTKIKDYTVFQSFNTETGEVLNSAYDSKQKGSVGLKPVISSDENVIAYQSEFQEQTTYYRTERYFKTSFVFADEYPMLKMGPLKNFKATQWAISEHNNEYYLYYNNFNSFNIIKLVFHH